MSNSSSGRHLAQSQKVTTLSESFSNKILRISKSIKLRSDGIIFCGHVRVYDNGTCSISTPNFKHFEYLFDVKCHLVAHVPETLLHQENISYLIPENGAYSAIMKELRARFGLKNVFNRIQRHVGYYDCFCFAFSINKYEAVNFYLNNTEDLDRFSLDFIDKVLSNIGNETQNLISLDNRMLSNIRGLKRNFESQLFYDDATLNSFLRGKFVNLSRRSNITLTAREQECLKYLFLGYTAKQTGEILGLSFRTIESYLDNIKNKLGCFRKTEILTRIISSSDRLT
jgi:DNA-binding CsgD family transcriptional regulator